MTRISQDFLLTLCGAGTSLATATALGTIEANTGVAFTAAMALYVPVGAIAAGFIASIGYYAGSRIFQLPPTRLLAWNVVVIATVSFFVLHYSKYSAISLPGGPLSARMSFAEYMRMVYQNSAMSSSGSGIKLTLGALGYALVPVQIAGFALGGLSVYRRLAARAYCGTCSAYMKPEIHAVRYSGKSEETGANFDAARRKLQEGDIRSAAAIVNRMATQDNGAYYQFVLDLWRCRKCRERFFLLHTRQRVDGKWEAIDAMMARGAVPHSRDAA